MKVVLRHNFRKSSNPNEPEAQNEDCKVNFAFFNLHFALIFQHQIPLASI